MIITKTPFRISFFGGGTDYPVWYKEHGGAVISTSINKYCYISARYLPPFFDYKHRIRYYLNEEVNNVEDVKHPSVRECLKFRNINRGVEIVHNADLICLLAQGWGLVQHLPLVYLMPFMAWIIIWQANGSWH